MVLKSSRALDLWYRREKPSKRLQMASGWPKMRSMRLVICLITIKTGTRPGALKKTLSSSIIRPWAGIQLMEIQSCIFLSTSDLSMGRLHYHWMKNWSTYVLFTWNTFTHSFPVHEMITCSYRLQASGLLMVQSTRGYQRRGFVVTCERTCELQPRTFENAELLPYRKTR